MAYKAILKILVLKINQTDVDLVKSGLTICLGALRKMKFHPSSEPLEFFLIGPFAEALLAKDSCTYLICLSAALSSSLVFSYWQLENRFECNLALRQLNLRAQPITRFP